MARNFVATSSQRLVSSATPITVPPFTMSCWFRPVSNTVSYTLMGLSNGSTSETHLLQQTTGSKIRVSATSGGTATTVDSVTASSVTGAWNHAAGVWSDTSNRAASLAGANTGAASSFKTPSGLTKVDVASNGASTPLLNGDIAECALWNVALADADVLALANGVAAWFVRPDALVFYAPLLHGYSPEIDLMKGNSLTLINTPLVIDHPPIRYRSGLGALCA